MLTKKQRRNSLVLYVLLTIQITNNTNKHYSAKYTNRKDIR